MTDAEKEEFLKKEAEEIRKKKSNIEKADVSFILSSFYIIIIILQIFL